MTPFEPLLLLVAAGPAALICGVLAATEAALNATTLSSVGQGDTLPDARTKAAQTLALMADDLHRATVFAFAVFALLLGGFVGVSYAEAGGIGGIALGLLGAGFFTIIFVWSFPAALSAIEPERTLMALAPTALALTRWVGAPVEIARLSVRRSLSLLGDGRDATDMEAAHENIREAIDLHHAQGAVALSDRNMLSGLLDLKQLSVADVMVHRQNMVMLDIALDPEVLLERVLTQPHTRLPLYRGDPENIIGILHAKDLLRVLARARGNLKGINILALAARPWFVPDTTLLADQLRAFLNRRSHFALIVDEYGVVKGLLTLEDILEEIVGEIRDEHDLPVSGVRPQADGTINVDGWATIRDLNRAMNWSLPDTKATTIAGLVIHESRAIPEPGQVFSFHGFKFEILKRQRNQVTAIRITPPANGMRKTG